MKYCINFNKKSQYLQHIDDLQVDEINIIYNVTKVKLNSFLDKFPNTRINILIADSAAFLEAKKIEEFVELRQTYKNFYIKIKTFTEDSDIILFNLFKDNRIPTYFAVPIDDWEDLRFILNVGVSDIYITNQLGFELNYIKQFTNQKNIQIRAIANRAQRTNKNTPALKSFFIRPEDVTFYEDYIDVIEFDLDNNRLNEDILYKIYAVDRCWEGQLKEIILDFDNDLNSLYMEPHFSYRRADCGRQCIRDGRCQICEKAYALSAALEENKIMFKKKKLIK